MLTWPACESDHSPARQFLTLHSAGDEHPLLMGRLVLRRVPVGSSKGKPMLAVQVWSPWTRAFHEVDVPGPTIGLEAVVEAVMPCGRVAYLGLDPTNRAGDRKTSIEAKASLRRWLIQRSLAEGQPVDRMAVGRELAGVV